MLSKSHSSAQVHKMRALCENVVVRQVMRACWPHESPFNAPRSIFRALGVNFFFHGCCETRFCCPVLYEPQVGIPTAGSKEGKETRAPFVRPSSHCRVVASLSPSPPRPRVRFGQEDDALTCLALPDLALPCLALRPCLPRQLDFCLKSTLLSSCICPLHGPPFWQGRRDAHI